MSGTSPAHDLIRLALAIAEGRVAQSVRRTAGRAAYLAATAALVAGCALGVVGCLLTALWIYVLPHVGAVGAPLVVAAVLLVIGLGVLALMHRAARPRRAPVAADPGRAALLAELSNLGEISELVRAQKGPALIAALVAGLMAGSRDR
ncbi:MAG: hypothetical protein WDN04_19390 [Rhodospirillales bacterium]